jgi:outer membrane protein
MKKKHTTYFKSISLLVIVTICFLVACKKESNKPKIAYIDNVLVYNSFNMTSDLGKENDKKYALAIKKYDSIKKDFTEFEKKYLSEKSNSKSKKNEYLEKQRLVFNVDREFESLKQHVKKDIDAKVWNRLNALIKTYGETKKIDIILGTQGQGNIMYADTTLNVTNDFIEFANHKYEGN